MKRLLIVLMALLMLAGCRKLNGTVSEDDIAVYVKSNIEKLEAIMEVDLPRDYIQLEKIIENYLGESSMVEDIHRDSEAVWFECWGKGIGEPSTLSGFYYTPDDIPVPYWFVEGSFEELEHGEYYWESEDGLKSYYTNRILKNWFYFKRVWK